MFFRIKNILCCLIFLLSCKTGRRQKNPDSAATDSLISRYVAEKKTDSVLLIADKKISTLSNDPGSRYACLKFNQWILDQLDSVKREWPATKKYLENIITLAEKYPADSILQPALAKACYKWADAYFYKVYKPGDSVIEYYEKAIGFHRKISVPETKDVRYAYKNLGVLYNMLGDTKKTLAYYQLEKQLLPPDNNNAAAGNAINCSIAFRESGLMDSSINVIKQVLLLPGIKPLKMADMLSTLSEAQLQKGLLKEGEVNVLYALRILDTLQSADDVNEKKAMALKQKGILERVAGSYQNSIKTLKRSLECFHKIINPEHKRSDAKIYIELGKSFEEAVLTDSALNCYQFALSIVTPADPVNIFSLPALSQLYAENTIMEALDSKAAAMLKKFSGTGQIHYAEAAMNCYELAFMTERKLMQYFSYDDSKLVMLKTSRIRSRDAIELCRQLQKLTNDPVWAEKAFSFAEKSKSFVLLGSVQKNIAANAFLQNDSLYQKVQALQLQLSYIDKSIFENSLIKNDPELIQLNKQKKDLEGQILLAETALGRNNSAYHAEMIKEYSFSIPDIKNNLLDDHTGLLEFFSGDDAVYIFSLTKNAPPLFIKADDSLSNSISHFLQFFTDKNKINNDPVAYQAAAYRLYQQTSLSTVTKEEISKLIIIPDGLLNFVPFDALVTGIKTEQNPQLFSYMLFQKQISYGYSAATLLKQSTNSSITSSDGIAFFAPVFSNKERGKAPLLHTLEEAEAIKREKSSGKYFIKDQATIGHFRNNMAGAGIIHIASHASADTSGNLQPMIEFYDSSLTLNEIYAMHINPRLVVLSACETGIGVIDKSEGAMSLARGFYYAGAQNVITSLWNADDKSTAGIFSRFYADIKNNDYSRALYHSKQDYIKTATISTASPYYWAGFVHIGYSNRKKQGLHFSFWLIISASLIILISILYFIRKRK